MNVAEHLNALGSRTPAQWVSAANRVLPAVVAAVLVVTIAYQLSRITWQLLPGEDYAAPPPVVATGAGGLPERSAGTDFEALRRSHLFGEAPEPDAEPAAPPAATPVDAPDTSLNLRLAGVVVREVDEESHAMIANGNQPDKRYRIGETIEGVSGTRLHHVYEDRVLLNRSGRLETLRMPEEDEAGANIRRAATSLPAAPIQTNTSPLREVISQNATEITRVMRFAPHVEGGQIVGFRVTPGPEAEVFSGLGLEPGDVVTDINGIQLDDPSRGLQAFEALGESTMANVTILRDGNPQVIVIDTTQLEALSDGRQ
ncbi:MAG: type II secretion system protein GspC [Gammaproteobacteria bacterium]